MGWILVVKRDTKKGKKNKEKMLDVTSNVIGKEKSNGNKMEWKHRRESVCMFIITWFYFIIGVTCGVQKNC